MRLPIARRTETTCALSGYRGRLCLSIVALLIIGAFAGAKGGHVGPVHAPLAAVTPGVTAAGIDEHALAAGRLADPETVDADVGEPDGQAHHGPGRVFVRHGAALGVVHVPGLAVVPRQLGMDRVLDQQVIEHRGRVLAVAQGARLEEGAELGPQVPQRIQVVAGHAGVEVLPVGDQGPQPVQVREPVAVFAPATGRVHQPNREFGVGVEVQSRSRVMVSCPCDYYTTGPACASGVGSVSRESYRMHSGLPGDSLFPPVWASPSADEVSGAGQGHTAADCMRTAGSGTNPKGWWWPVPRVVIACQGGGSRTAFTAGVLRRMLGSQELAGYEIAGLSGTSGGAVCALLAWYALRDDDPALAGSLLEQFWIGNSARMPADALLNTWILWAGAWQDLGVTPPAVSPYHTPAAAIGAEQ